GIAREGALFDGQHAVIADGAAEGVHAAVAEEGAAADGRSAHVVEGTAVGVGAAVAGEGAGVDGHRPFVVDAAPGIGCRVARDDAAAQRQRPGRAVVEAAATAARTVAGNRAITDGQNPLIGDAAAEERCRAAEDGQAEERNSDGRGGGKHWDPIVAADREQAGSRTGNGDVLGKAQGAAEAGLKVDRTARRGDSKSVTEGTGAAIRRSRNQE